MILSLFRPEVQLETVFTDHCDIIMVTLSTRFLIITNNSDTIYLSLQHTYK